MKVEDGGVNEERAQLLLLTSFNVQFVFPDVVDVEFVVAAAVSGDTNHALAGVQSVQVFETHFLHLRDVQAIVAFIFIFSLAF